MSAKGRTGVVRPGMAVLASLLVGLAGTPAAADFAAAVEAYDQGDYATTFTESKPLAKAGDAEAQYMLGYLYARGEGVGRNRVRAYVWFARAAAQGDAIAADAAATLARRLAPADLATARRLLAGSE